MTVPYIFATQTSALPLSQLDADLAYLELATSVNFTPSGTGAVSRTVTAKLDETKTPEDFLANTTPGTTDMTTGIVAALAASSIVYLKNTDYLISSRIDLTNKWLIMSERTRILMAAASFTGSKTSSTGCGFLFSSATSGGIVGGMIRMNTSSDTDALVCIGVRVLSSSNVQIRGVDFNTFSKANGLVSIDTSNYTMVTGCRFRDCTTNTSATGQITGINQDDNKIGGVGSVGTNISGCTFTNLTVGATFLAANGYQTDGINIQTTGTATAITGCVFDTLGEGIDCYGDGGTISGNSVKNSYYYGVKLVHGAQNWQVTGNQIMRSGIAGVVLGGSSTVTQYTEKNQISNNVISDIDPNNLGGNTACILLTDNGGGTYKCRNNVLRDNYLNPGTYGKYAIDRSGSSGSNNQFPNNHFQAVGVTGWVNNGSETGRVTASNKTAVRAYVGATQTYTTGQNAKLQFNTEQWDDRAEFDPTTNYRWTCQIPGLYRVKIQVRSTSVTTANSDMSVRIRLNATTVLANNVSNGDSNLTYTVEDVVNVAAGDFIEGYFVNGDSASVDITADSTFSYMTIEPA